MTEAKILELLYRVQNGDKELDDVVKVVEDDVATKQLKPTERSMLSVFKKMINKPGVQGVFQCAHSMNLHGEKVQAITDFYRIYAKKGKKFSTLPKPDGDYSKLIKSLEGIIESCYDNEDEVELTMIDAKRAIAMAKIDRGSTPVMTVVSKKGRKYDFDAQFIVDSLKVLQENSAVFKIDLLHVSSESYSVRPAIAENDKAFVLVVPIRRDDYYSMGKDEPVRR